MNKLLISKSGFELQEIELVHGSICIGRAKDNDIQLNDATVSSHHAKIVTVMSTSYIQDLGSTNGVFVNGKPVVVQALHPDDVISIGKHEILYHQEGAKESSQDENVYDAHVMKTLVRAGTTGARESTSVTNKPFTDFRETINFSDANFTEMDQPAPGIRVVVDNTGNEDRAVGTVNRHSLDIDINFDNYLTGNTDRSSDPATQQTKSNSGVSNPYIATNPYVEVPSTPPVAKPTNQSVDLDQNEYENISDSDGLLDTHVQSSAVSDEEPAKHEPMKQSTSMMNELVSTASDNTANINRQRSKQPFMSSEEVVEQLIQMGRDKAKRSRKKTSSLSSILGVITFVAILAAVYFQLQ